VLRNRERGLDLYNLSHVDYLVVAGGAGASGGFCLWCNRGSGGGGAGGYRTSFPGGSSIPLSVSGLLIQ
jgi:hypothetical protein